MPLMTFKRDKQMQVGVATRLTQLVPSAPSEE